MTEEEKEIASRRWPLSHFPDGRLPPTWVWCEATNHEDSEPFFVAMRKTIRCRHPLFMDDVRFIDPVYDAVPQGWVRDD